ncbi:uncharacterized protein L199_004383 [Kwoniella botswanensis]|uniref:uncharacterized protein n=1 Tax=Kwoniella botswanensis TaxID=1268659 RepID=UPI00315CC4AE
MASLIVLSGVVGYYLYKENKDRKEKKLGTKNIGAMTGPGIAVSTAIGQNKLGELEQYEEIPPTYQNVLIPPPAQYTHELSYTSTNDNDRPVLKSNKEPEKKNKRRSRFFRKPGSLQE